MDIFIRVLMAIVMQEVVEFYICRWVICYLEKGWVVIFGVGLGNFFFIIDIIVVLWVVEIDVEVVFKVIKVDGVYDFDFKINFNVCCFIILIYSYVLVEDFKVMDSMAIVLCKDNNIFIMIFDLGVFGNIVWVIKGEVVGMLVGENCEVS